MRSALLLTLCACLLLTLSRIVLLAVPAHLRPLPEMLVTLLAFGGCSYLGLCVLDGDHSGMLPRRALTREQILGLSVTGVLLVSPMTLASDLWRALFAPGAAPDSAGMATGAEAAMFLLQVIRSALLAPVCEELFFRGYLLGALRRYGRGRALLLSSLCFALAHGVSVGGLAVYTLLGLLLGAIMLKAQSVLAPMLVHGCYNLTIVLIAYSGLSPLFDRLSLISCVLRLALCAAFMLALRRAYTAAPAQHELLLGGRLNKRDIALLASALLALVLAVVISGVPV